MFLPAEFPPLLADLGCIPSIEDVVLHLLLLLSLADHVDTEHRAGRTAACKEGRLVKVEKWKTPAVAGVPSASLDSVSVEESASLVCSKNVEQLLDVSGGVLQTTVRVAQRRDEFSEHGYE